MAEQFEIYNDPAGGAQSTVGAQLRIDAYNRAALIDAKELEFFGQLSDITQQPKHYGKTIKRYHYLHLLDDLNLNSQGIDAAGLQLDVSLWYVFSGGFVVQDIAGYATEALARAAAAAGESVGIGSGNLYGSSKDIGTLVNRFPVLGETGGTVNGVSVTRVTIQSNLEKFGFHDKYTKESMDFDTDAEREMHLRREMVNAASQINEAQVQVDLINAATTIRYGGAATSRATMTAEGVISELTYDDLMRIDIALNVAKCPKGSKLLSGTLLTNTRVTRGARPLYVGTELLPTLKNMVNNFGEQAFISSEFYAANTTLMRGEIGRIDAFAIIEVPQMLSWQGGGAAVTANPGYREANGRYSVFPMLAVGSGSFSQIGFASDGKNNKFKIKHVMPESDISYAKEEFGETGFISIKWYYGILVLRHEWLGLMHTVAKL